MADDNKDTMFTYLERLRQSGATNMFGAAPYLQREFDISLAEPDQVLANWMNSKAVSYTHLKLPTLLIV